jgi:hypothetical protein
MSIIREFEKLLTESAYCFLCCLSVVSVVLVVAFDSFGRVWHLSVNSYNITINHLTFALQYYCILIVVSWTHLVCCSGWFVDVQLSVEGWTVTHIYCAIVVWYVCMVE